VHDLERDTKFKVNELQLQSEQIESQNELIERMERSLYERQSKLSSLEQMQTDERDQASYQINNKNREI
jgi:hypothetical protein